MFLLQMGKYKQGMSMDTTRLQHCKICMLEEAEALSSIAVQHCEIVIWQTICVECESWTLEPYKLILS